MGKVFRLEDLSSINTKIDNCYSKTVTTIDGTVTRADSLYPGHYAIDGGITTANGWPYDDSDTYHGTLLVLGRYNAPSYGKGYRVFLYFDNKSRMAYFPQWWGAGISSDKWIILASSNANINMMCNSRFNLKDSNIIKGSVTEDTWSNNIIAFFDNAGTRVGYIQPMYMADGTVNLHICSLFGDVYINGIKFNTSSE